MENTLTLTLQGQPAETDFPPGWNGRSYALGASVRDAAGEAQQISVPAQAILEIELTNGQRVLVAAEDAERYLGRATPTSTPNTKNIQVGSTLRPNGPNLPPTSRDGMGAWALKALRVYDSGPAGMTALALAGSFQDAQLDQRNGLYRMSVDAWQLTPTNAMPASTEPTLLFLHGTASSCEGSFSGLWGGSKTEVDIRADIRNAYADRVFGYEHRSLTESPVQNALDLVGRLPQGARLHLVTHSRGGMLGELLARAGRVDAEPITEAEVQAFVDRAKQRAPSTAGKQAAEAEGTRLRDLNRALQQKAIRVERFVRVAAPMRGTTLASGRLDRWASVMLNVIGGALDLLPLPTMASKVYSLGKSFLLKVVEERTNALLLPGLEAMMPTSPLVSLLNDGDKELDSPVHVIAGDYGSDGLLSWLANWLSESFYDSQTDWVVNTPSMSGGARRKQGLWHKLATGPDVCHFSYFRRTETVQPLLKALAGRNDGFELLNTPSRSVVARGGEHVRPKENAPIALMLPGIMGSELELNGEEVWPSVLGIGLAFGSLEKLKLTTPTPVTVDGWIGYYYERFSLELSADHEVRPFAYDWRLSMLETAQKFGGYLDNAMDDALARGKPLHIVAHSMGGLVARLALKGRWARFKSIPGSRLVQFGTPNMGSHSMAAVLTGRDPFVQLIESIDLKHNMKDLLEVVSGFPGVLELLPWPVNGHTAIDGKDYFDPALWQAWSQADAENNRAIPGLSDWKVAKGGGDGWPAPNGDLLKEAKATVNALLAAPVDPACTVYVAGEALTPLAIQLNDGQLEIRWTDAGDGRVPWCTGIPPGVPAWRVKAAHGDLMNEEAAFPDYLQLINTGHCQLARVSPEMQATPDMGFRPAVRSTLSLCPTPLEVLAAAMGGATPNQAPKHQDAPVAVEVCHDNLACAKVPVLIGAYANDPLRGSAEFIDRMLGGQLSCAKALGRYPNHPGDVSVFWQPQADTLPAGAVVVGLGPVGELKPGELVRALTHGMTEYANRRASTPNAAKPVEIACLLVGTGFGGLSVSLGVRALLDAIDQANELLQRSGCPSRLGTVRIYEEEESRAIAAAQSLLELASGARYRDVIRTDGHIRRGDGGYRGRGVDDNENAWQRVHVVANGSGLRFTLVSDRARNEVNDEPDQQQAVDGLLKNATTSTLEQPGLSRALFELMVPNGLKSALPDLRGAILAVDERAAVYPWELMRDEAGHTPPLSTRVGMIRQLASPHGRSRVATVSGTRVLVVGDTDSGHAPLTGAQREGRAVAALFRGQGYQVVDLQRPDGQTLFVELFDGGYCCVHIAAHGAVATDDGKGGKTGHTGVVLGANTYLTAAQVAKMRQVPEVVFLNCCHLGSMAEDARPRWGELASGLATQFIELGCKAVVAAGWMVNDDAADVFANTFWNAMLTRTAFGEAVRLARAAAHDRYPGCNTWGAYQAYGDERFKLRPLTREDNEDNAPTATARDYLHEGQALTDLDRLSARLRCATTDERARLTQELRVMERALSARFFHLGSIRERLGDLHKEVGNREQAIAHYRAALTLEDGGPTLHAMEQLGNLEVRHGEFLVDQASIVKNRTAADDAQIKAGQQLLTMGTERINTLLGLGATVERLSLKASAHKRSASVHAALHKGHKKAWMTELKAMTQAYLDATACSHLRNGETDYYPLLNAVDGALVLAAHGVLEPLAQLESKYPHWAADSRANAARRLVLENRFFHAVGELDAQRVQALRHCLNPRSGSAALTDPAVRDPLLQAYGELFRRTGTVSEKDSVRAHLSWLIRMWPANQQPEAKLALQALQDGLAALR